MYLVWKWCITWCSVEWI